MPHPKHHVSGVCSSERLMPHPKHHFVFLTRKKGLFLQSRDIVFLTRNKGLFLGIVILLTKKQAVFGFVTAIAIVPLLFHFLTRLFLGIVILFTKKAIIVRSSIPIIYRRTVEVKTSLGRWFESCSQELFYLLIVKF